MKELFKREYEKLRPSVGVFLVLAALIFLISIFWSLIRTTILPNHTVGIYNVNFWEAVIVEAHGLLLDIFVIGIILFGINLKNEAKERVVKLSTEIDDLRGKNDNVSQNSIFKNVKELQRLGINKLNLWNCYLEGSDLSQLNCPNSLFFKVHFRGTRLPASNFFKADFSSADLRETVLFKCDFEESSLQNADLGCASVFRTNFCKANICGARLQNTNDSETAIWTGAIYDQNTKFPEWMTAEKLHELGMINSTRS